MSTQYEVSVSYSPDEIILNSFIKTTGCFSTPAHVENLRGLPQSNGSLLVSWNPPLEPNASKICYYEIEIWKQDMPHSSYYFKVYTEGLSRLFTEMNVVNDPLIIKVWAINTNTNLDGATCYGLIPSCSGRYKSEVATVKYYNPVNGLNSSSSIFEIWCLRGFLFLNLFIRSVTDVFN